MLDLQYDIPDKEVRRWACFCHLGALVGGILLPPIGIILVPLVIWIIKRDEHFYIAEQGRESINFQISMLLYALVAKTIIMALKIIWIGHLFGWLPYMIYISQLLLSIVGAIRAWDGEKFRYPFAIPFISK
jgi:hypothetical protein